MIQHIAVALSAFLYAAVALQSPSSTATIEVMGGRHAGKHTIKSPPDVGCMMSESGKSKRFEVNYGIPAHEKGGRDPAVFTFVQVVIRNAGVKGAAQPDSFVVAVNFGPFQDAKGTMYMSGRNPTSGKRGGTGTVVLTDRGKSMSVALDLRPAEGIAIKGTLTCTNPLRY